MLLLNKKKLFIGNKRGGAERDKDSAKSHLRFNINYQDYTHFVLGLRWWLVWLLNNLWVNPCTYIDPLGVKTF